MTEILGLKRSDGRNLLIVAVIMALVMAGTADGTIGVRIVIGVVAGVISAISFLAVTLVINRFKPEYQ